MFRNMKNLNLHSIIKYELQLKRNIKIKVAQIYESSQ